MPSKTHRTRVNFEDNIRFVPATSYNSTNQGPRFPNLQSLFKQYSNQNDKTTEETTQVSAPVHAEDKTSKRNSVEPAGKNKEDVHKEAVHKEDVNSEVADFIKRRHHNLELQKLLSMKANA